MKPIETLTKSAIDLLKDLIAIPSFSGEEDQTASRIGAWLSGHGIPFERKGNNIYAFNQHFEPGKPLLLMNSHHDTVRPNSAYTRDPFTPAVEDGKLYGLGSNDAGGPLVSLLAAFAYWSLISAMLAYLNPPKVRAFCGPCNPTFHNLSTPPGVELYCFLKGRMPRSCVSLAASPNPRTWPLHSSIPTPPAKPAPGNCRLPTGLSVPLFLCR